MFGISHPATPSLRSRSWPILACAIVCGSVSSQPINQVLMTEAWQFYENNDYGSASKKCNELITRFKVDADEDEGKLKEEKAPAIPTRTAPSDTEKKMAFERGLVNDVGACFFILGFMAENDKNFEAAHAAYANAMRYTYARVYDPKQSPPKFWSPSESARRRKAALIK